MFLCLLKDDFAHCQTRFLPSITMLLSPQVQESDRFKLLFDPQTSGGLLLSVPGAQAAPCLQSLRNHGMTEAAIIGRVSVSKREGQQKGGICWGILKNRGRGVGGGSGAAGCGGTVGSGGCRVELCMLKLHLKSRYISTSAVLSFVRQGSNAINFVQLTCSPPDRLPSHHVYHFTMFTI